MKLSSGSIVAAALTAALAAVLLPAIGCGSANVGMNRGFDDYDDAAEYDDTMSPDAFADRLGEPDEWRNEGDGDALRMTAIWYCLDDEYREIQWRIQQRDRGPQTWVVIEDIRRDCKKSGS